MKEWTQVLNERFVEWWLSFLKFLPDFLLAVLVIIIAGIAGRYTKKGVQRLSTRFSRKAPVNNYFSTFFQVLIVFIGIFICLDILGLNKTVSSLLAGAGIIGIILGLALQDIISNFIAGVYIAFKKPFVNGHTVKTNDFIGNVEDIQLRSTIIRTFSGLHLMIPNKEIIQKPMINYSLTPARRIELEFFIDQQSDLTLTHSVAMEALSKIEYLYPGKPVEVYFNDIKYNAIKLAVWFWIDNHLPPGYMVARHEAIFNILSGFKDKNIMLINTPQPAGFVLQ